MTFNGIGGSWAATGDVTVNGTLRSANGTYKANTHTTDVTGLTTVSGTGIYLASTATQTLSGGLTVNGGTFTGSSGIVATSNVTFHRDVNSASGTLNVSGNWVQSDRQTFNSNNGYGQLQWFRNAEL